MMISDCIKKSIPFMECSSCRLTLEIVAIFYSCPYLFRQKNADNICKMVMRSFFTYGDSRYLVG